MSKTPGGQEELGGRIVSSHGPPTKLSRRNLQRDADFEAACIAAAVTSGGSRDSFLTVVEERPERPELIEPPTQHHVEVEETIRFDDGSVARHEAEVAQLRETIRHLEEDVARGQSELDELCQSVINYQSEVRDLQRTINGLTAHNDAQVTELRASLARALQGARHDQM